MSASAALSAGCSGLWLVGRSVTGRRSNLWTRSEPGRAESSKRQVIFARQLHRRGRPLAGLHRCGEIVGTDRNRQVEQFAKTIAAATADRGILAGKIVLQPREALAVEL